MFVCIFPHNFLSPSGLIKSLLDNKLFSTWSEKACTGTPGCRFLWPVKDKTGAGQERVKKIKEYSNNAGKDQDADPLPSIWKDCAWKHLWRDLPGYLQRLAWGVGEWVRKRQVDKS